MTPEEYVEAVRKRMKDQYANVDPSQTTVSLQDHLNEINTILNNLLIMLPELRYEFECESASGEVVELDGHEVNIRALKEKDTVIFQPLEFITSNLEDIDISSLQHAMGEFAKRTNMNVMMLPPQINVITAKLKQ